MAIYSLAHRFSPLAFVSTIEYRTGERAAKILELIYVNNAAAVPQLALGRPATIGSGGTPLAFTPDDPDEPPATTFAYTSWSGRPVAPAIFMRRFAFNNGEQGHGPYWSWRSGLVIPPYSSVAIWNIANVTPSPCDVSCVIEE